jgi:hypothetical protein
VKLKTSIKTKQTRTNILNNDQFLKSSQSEKEREGKEKQFRAKSRQTTIHTPPQGERGYRDESNNAAKSWLQPLKPVARVARRQQSG